MRLNIGHLWKCGCFFGLTILFMNLMGGPNYKSYTELHEVEDVIERSVSGEMANRPRQDVIALTTARPKLLENIPLQKEHMYLIAGQPRSSTVFLAMGLPTVKRNGASYLYKTLDSIVHGTTRSEQDRSILVIFLADFDKTWVEQTAESIVKKYKSFLDSGFVQVIYASENMYPELKNLKRTFNDSDERVRWRSKQNVDYANLFLYCRNLSTYYIQLEDDIIAASSFVNQIGKTIQSKADNFWFCLHFSRLGFIGKLFRSKDLEKIARFLLMFYSEQPCDLLLNYITHIMTQFKDIFIKPALFEHAGIVSSLKGKKQYLTEQGLNIPALKGLQKRKFFNHSNPEAKIATDIVAYSSYTPEEAYNEGNGFFWGYSPKKGNFFRIIFKTAQNISRIYVATGLKEVQKDILKEGILTVSTSSMKIEPCHRAHTVCSFESGHIDTDISKTILPFNIQCITIEITKNQTEWLIIREISVFQQSPS